MRDDKPYGRLAAFYFFYFSALGGFLPFWSLYLESAGYDSREIGELSALLVGTKIVAPNLWGWIADRTGKSLKIIRIASFFAALFFAGFLFKSGYFWFALITVGFSFFWNAALPQFEAATLYHLKDDAHRYSQIRLWGSVGFIVTVLGIGRILDVQDIQILPYIIVMLLTFIWLIALATPEARAVHHVGEHPGLWQILKAPELIAFLAVYLLQQAAHGPYYVFYSVYLKEHHYSGTVTGLLWAIGVCAEIVLFVFMRGILGRFSLRQILLVSVALGILRWVLIAWCVESSYLLVTAQILHAATFGSAHVAAIHLVHRYFGSRHQGKGQALYSSLSFGLGGMLGSLYSGYYWQTLGPEWVYSIAAILSGISFVIAFIWVGRENVRNSPSLG
ncbi:MAG: MFS transporter [Gammaproteobacteria bacterium]